jgi:mannose-1-phosphate guanylyltransferase
LEESSPIMPNSSSLDHLHIFIMAGGSGERFWPMSRTKTPKHLLRLLSDQTLLETTARRVEGLVPWERVFVLTNSAQADSVRAELPFLPADNILAEPEKRDTAPACALATGFARARDPEAICALLPADAMIHKVPVFQRQLAEAANVACESEALVAFAIPPTCPATGFGYLHLGDESGGARQVLRFVEKPDLPTAEIYYRSGQYGWNAGMFIWKASAFLQETERLAPELAGFVRDFPAGDPVEFLAKRFPGLPKISVDYAIMEKASCVLAVKAHYDWDDVGSWTALPEHLGHDDDGNTVRGEVVPMDSKNNVVISNGRTIALCGVDDLVVVETPDAILVCHRDAVQDIKKLQPLLKDALR